MIWILLLLVLWVGGGYLLLHLGTRPTGTDYKRTTEAQVVAVGERLGVTLELAPPRLEKETPPHDVILAIDHSGSMGRGPGSPLREALRAAENFIRRLPQQVHVGLIGFNHEATLLCDIEKDKTKVIEALDLVMPGGRTQIHTALDLCHDILLGGREEVRKTVILLSDGGSARPRAKAAANRIKGLDTSPQILTIGFGPSVKEDLMRDIASDPEYYLHTNSIEELNNLFSKRVGKDVVLMAFMGDTALPADSRVNKALRHLDGYIKRFGTDASVHDYTIPGAPTYTGKGGVFSQRGHELQGTLDYEAELEERAGMR